MEQEHKDSLRRNYVQLVKETPVDAVVDHLYQVGVLTDELREEILHHSNSYTKSRQLISTLQRRGSRAFDEFCSALTIQGKFNLVNLLKPNLAKTSKELCMLSIGGDVFVVASEWREQILIHIRKYEKNSADNFIPTKKGVALSQSQWQLLEMYANEIDDAIGQMMEDNGVPEITFHLGKGVYVTVNRTYPTVDVRQRWMVPESGEVVSTKKGVSLPYDRWEALKETFPEIRKVIPEMENTQPCILSDSHQNQEGMLTCSFCNPFGQIV